MFRDVPEETVYSLTDFPFDANSSDPYEIQASTRMSQLIQFWKDNPDFTVTPAKHSSHYITRNKTISEMGYDPLDTVQDYNYFVQDRQEDKMIVVDVLEVYQGNMSEHYGQGGSSMRGIIQGGGILYVCSFRDHFNGSYSLKCPVFSRCVHVNITVLHFNYKQFQGVSKRLDITILDKETCVSFKTFHEKPNSYWRLDSSEEWKWTSGGVSYPMANDTRFCELVDAMTRDRFYMIGSSHMRYKHMYIMTTCLKFIGDLDKRLFFIKAIYGKEVIDVLEQFTSKSRSRWFTCRTLKYKTTAENVKHKKSSKEIEKYLEYLRNYPIHRTCGYDQSIRTGLMIQVGSWDLVYNGLLYSLQKLMPKMDRTLHKLVEFQKTNPFSMLVVGPPTFHPQAVYAENRNNDMIQLFSHVFQTTAENHTLDYINVFDMMYPKFDRVTENNHYIECNYESCHYEVGIVPIQLAVKALADDNS